MSAYAAGDRDAFRALFRELGPRIHAFFLRSFRDPAVSDELLQITFMNVHRARATYREGSPVAPWVFTIAANVRRDELRRRMRRKEDLDEAALDDAVDVTQQDADPQADALIADRVRAAVDALPEPQRVVVHLHRFEELTFPQIAGVLGLSEVAVRVRASRAYTKLREELRGLSRGGAS